MYVIRASGNLLYSDFLAPLFVIAIVSDFEKIHVSGFGNRRPEVVTSAQEDSNNNSMAEEEKVEEEMG